MMSNNYIKTKNNTRTITVTEVCRVEVREVNIVRGEERAHNTNGVLIAKNSVSLSGTFPSCLELESHLLSASHQSLHSPTRLMGRREGRGREREKQKREDEKVRERGREEEGEERK